MKRHLIYHTHIALNDANLNNQNRNTVNIETFDQQLISTSLQSISKNGLTIICDQHDLKHILPNTTSVAPKQPVQLPVSFTLSEKIEASCNVVCVRRLSKDIFQMDMRFRNMNAKDEELVDQYIENSFRPKQCSEPLSNVA